MHNVSGALCDFIIADLSWILAMLLYYWYSCHSFINSVVNLKIDKLQKIWTILFIKLTVVTVMQSISVSLNGIWNQVQMNTKDLSGISIVIRMKLQNTVEKQITTLVGIRRNLLIGKFLGRSKNPYILWRILITLTKSPTSFLKYGFLD